MGAPWKQKATAGAKTDIPPAGSHAAVLVGLIDLGTHVETFKDEKKGERTAELRKVMLVWELPGEKLSGKQDETHLMARDYNVTFSQKSALRKMVEGWRGKAFAEGEEFDITKLLGQACLLNVIHKTSSNDNTYAKLDGISPLPKGMPKPAPTRKLVTWQIDGGDVAELSWVPYLYGEPVATVIGRSLERSGGTPAGVGAGEAEGENDGGETPF